MGEHRSAPMVIDMGSAGRVTVTRIRSVQGRESLEVRAGLALSPASPARHAAILAEEIAGLVCESAATMRALAA